jgi:hypothetical protein
LRPRARGFCVVDEIVGYTIILHHLTVFAIGSEGAHPASLEFRAVRVIDFEVEHVVDDQGEE